MMSLVCIFCIQFLIGLDEFFSFVVYGDMGLLFDFGVYDIVKYMIEEVKKGKLFVFYVGDILYVRGYVSWIVNKSFFLLICLYWLDMFFLKNGVYEFCVRKVIGRQ